MSTIIGIYNYTYGVGNQPNRQIQFSRIGLNPRTIQADVFVLRANAIGNRISTLQGSQISVEMESTTAKMIALIREVSLRPDRNLSNFSIQQQNAIIRSLEPIGYKNIEIENQVNPNGVPEVVSSLSIFDPS